MSDQTTGPGPVSFDPWMPLEQAVAQDWSLTEEQLMQGVMARGLMRDSEAIVNGSGLDVLEAIQTCIRYKLVVPEWLGDAFRKRLNSVRLHEVASWDSPQAFGKPFPKGAHLARLRKDSRSGPVIYQCVRQLLTADPTRPIDESLFEDVAAKFAKNVKGLGRSECQRIYYAVAPDLDAMYGPIPGRATRGSAAK